MPTPGAGLLDQFDATAWGLRGNAGFRFNMRPRLHRARRSACPGSRSTSTIIQSAARPWRSTISRASAAPSGIRVGGDFQTGPAQLASPYIGIAAVDEFEGNVRNTFTLGQSIGLEQDAPGTFGELSAGATMRSGTVEAFIRGELDFGGERDGLAGPGGPARIRF